MNLLKYSSFCVKAKSEPKNQSRFWSLTGVFKTKVKTERKCTPSEGGYVTDSLYYLGINSE
jgi:hypothetical protein